MWNPNQPNHAANSQSVALHSPPLTLSASAVPDADPMASASPPTRLKDDPDAAADPDTELDEMHADDLPVPATGETNYFKQPSIAQQQHGQHSHLALAQAVAHFTGTPAGAPPPSPTNGQHQLPSGASASQTLDKSPSSSSSSHSQSALHPLLKQQQPPAPLPTTPFNNAAAIKHNQQSPVTPASASFSGGKIKTRSQGGRPKDAVWVYFHTNGNGTDERATCKYCGWHVERPKAFRMRDHVAQCAQIDPVRRAEMSQLIALKEAAAAAKQEEKAQLAATSGTSAVPGDVSPAGGGSAPKKKKIEHHPIIARPVFLGGKSPITCHVLDATSGKPGDEMGIRLDRLTSNGFVLLANGATDADGRCNNLLPGGSRPEIGIYKVTFFSNEFYQKRGIVSFYPFVEITFEVKDPTEHYHIPLLLSPYSFSTYRGS